MQPYFSDRCTQVQSGSHENAGSKADQNQGYYHDQSPVVRSPFKFLHADRREVRIFGMGGRCPSALYGRCVLYRQRQHSTKTWASRIAEFPVGHVARNFPLSPTSTALGQSSLPRLAVPSIKPSPPRLPGKVKP